MVTCDDCLADGSCKDKSDKCLNADNQESCTNGLNMTVCPYKKYTLTYSDCSSDAWGESCKCCQQIAYESLGADTGTCFVDGQGFDLNAIKVAYKGADDKDAWNRREFTQLVLLAIVMLFFSFNGLWLDSSIPNLFQLNSIIFLFILKSFTKDDCDIWNIIFVVHSFKFILKIFWKLELILYTQILPVINLIKFLYLTNVNKSRGLLNANVLNPNARKTIVNALKQDFHVHLSVYALNVEIMILLINFWKDNIKEPDANAEEANA